MSDVNVTPTSEIYGQLQAVWEHFNKALFRGELPSVVIILHRSKASAGHFSPSRWRHVTGGLANEIALNPVYFASQPLLRLFQTVVHEQCHLWQHVHGESSRPGYHNTKWAGKMTEIGLMPSSTGQPGGAKTGQRMSDYPVSGGLFLEACAELVSRKFELPWVDRDFKASVACRTAVATELGLETDVADRLLVTVGALFPGLEHRSSDAVAMRKQKIKYACPSCKTNVWGKSGLAITCRECDQVFQQVSPPRALDALGSANCTSGKTGRRP